MQYSLGKSATTLGRNLIPFIVVCAVTLTGGCAVKITPPPTAAIAAPATTTPAASSTSSTNSISSTSTSTTTTTTTSTTATAPVTASAGFDSVTNFGDSITCGYYAMPNDGAGYMYSNEGYATLFDTKLGATAKYLCRGGDMAADMAKLWVYPNTEPALGLGQLYTVLIGTNDAHFCGESAGCIANWSQSLAASLTWLALPESDKVLGAAMTASRGAWSADMDFGTATNESGATLSFDVNQIVAGRLLYIAYRVFDAAVLQGGTAVVSVDGVPVTALSANVSTGHPIATQNNTTDTVFLASVPLGAEGKHSVTITTNSAAGGFFSVLWAGASTQNYATVHGAPSVLIGQITTTGQTVLNQTVASYNAQLAPLVAGLAEQGMNIVVAPTANVLDVTTDMSDLLHPNNVGHAKVAAAFASVLAGS